MRRWQSQKSVTKSDFERVVTFNFPAGGCLPEISGSALIRRERKKRAEVKTPGGSFGPLEDLATDPGPELSAMEITEAGGLVDPEEKKLKCMSVRTARKIRNKITAMYRAGIAKTFITLTLVNDAPDIVALRCMQKLLKLWRDQWGKFSFLWVVERQQNGRVHFHIIIDKFIDIKKENARWVRLQYNSGIVYYKQAGKSQYAVDPTNLSNQKISEYLNPLDVEKIKDLGGLAAYLASYVTKKVGETYKIQTWNCSKCVSNLFTERFISTAIHDNCVKTFPGAPNLYIYTRDYIDRKTKKVKYKAGHVILPVDHFNDHAAWVYILNANYANSWLTELDEINRAVYAGVFMDTFIDYLDYAGYCRRFQSLHYVNYREYHRRYHGRQNYDAQYYGDIEARGLDPENDFYQWGKTHKGKTLAAMYCSAPRIDAAGRRWYGDVMLSDYNLYLLNQTIKQQNEQRTIKQLQGTT